MFKDKAAAWARTQPPYFDSGGANCGEDLIRGLAVYPCATLLCIHRFRVGPERQARQAVIAARDAVHGSGGATKYDQERCTALPAADKRGTRNRAVIGGAGTTAPHCGPRTTAAGESLEPVRTAVTWVNRQRSRYGCARAVWRAKDTRSARHKFISARFNVHYDIRRCSTLCHRAQREATEGKRGTDSSNATLDFF